MAKCHVYGCNVCLTMLSKGDGHPKGLWGTLSSLAEI